MNYFLDIGANVGQTFDQFLSKDSRFDGWKVGCFEPSPRHLQALIEKAKEYKHRYEITVSTFGVGGVSSPLEIYEKDDPMGDSFFPVLISDHETINRDNGIHIVPFKASISDLLSGASEDDYVVLKIDAEGSEYEILEELLRTKPKCVKEIFVEFHTIGEIHRAPEEIAHDFESYVPLKPWLL
jgi:FkbM family methyltransferase